MKKNTFWSKLMVEDPALICDIRPVEFDTVTFW